MTDLSSRYLVVFFEMTYGLHHARFAMKVLAIWTHQQCLSFGDRKMTTGMT